MLFVSTPQIGQHSVFFLLFCFGFFSFGSLAVGDFLRRRWTGFFSGSSSFDFGGRPRFRDALGDLDLDLGLELAE